MTNSAIDLDGSAPPENQGYLASDLLELAANLSNDCQQLPGLSVGIDGSIPRSSEFNRSIDERSAIEAPTNTIGQILNNNRDRDNMTGININANIESIDATEQSDVNTELNLLLTSLQLADPYPPTPTSVSNSNSITDILDRISTNVPLRELHKMIDPIARLI